MASGTILISDTRMQLIRWRGRRCNTTTHMTGPALCAADIVMVHIHHIPARVFVTILTVIKLAVCAGPRLVSRMAARRRTTTSKPCMVEQRRAGETLRTAVALTAVSAHDL